MYVRIAAIQKLAPAAPVLLPGVHTGQQPEEEACGRSVASSAFSSSNTADCCSPGRCLSLGTFVLAGNSFVASVDVTC